MTLTAQDKLDIAEQTSLETVKLLEYLMQVCVAQASEDGNWFAQEKWITQEDLGWSEWKVRHHTKELRRHGYIDTKVAQIDRVATCHYKITHEFQSLKVPTITDTLAPNDTATVALIHQEPGYVMQSKVESGGPRFPGSKPPKMDRDSQESGGPRFPIILSNIILYNSNIRVTYDSLLQYKFLYSTTRFARSNRQPPASAAAERLTGASCFLPEQRTRTKSKGVASNKVLHADAAAGMVQQSIGGAWPGLAESTVVEQPAQQMDLPEWLTAKQKRELHRRGWTSESIARATVSELVEVPTVGQVTARQLLGEYEPPPVVDRADVLAVIGAYQECLGHRVNYGAEMKAARMIVAYGFGPDEVREAYEHYKSEPFWTGRRLRLAYIADNIGSFFVDKRKEQERLAEAAKEEARQREKIAEIRKLQDQYDMDFYNANCKWRYMNGLEASDRSRPNTRHPSETKQVPVQSDKAISDLMSKMMKGEN